MNKLVVTAYPVVQNNTTLYLTAIAVGDLLDQNNFRVDRWNPVDQKGYQREINQSHAHRLGRYLGRGYIMDTENTSRSSSTPDRKLSPVSMTNVLPSSVVINFRKPLDVEAIKDGGGAVKITLLDWPGYIIDGQHRIEGAREIVESGEDSISDYQFPVCITQFSLEDEMVHFRNLNTTANRPPKGLNEVISHSLYEKYGRIPSSAREMSVNRATGITLRLATDVVSPFYGRFALGGMRKRANHTTSQSQFTSSFDSLFTSGRFSNPDFSNDSAYEMMLNFWLAVQEVWPQATANPESTFILAHLGYRPLNKILARIFNNITITPTYDDFVVILNNIKKNSAVGDPDGWIRGTGTLVKIAHGYSLTKGTQIATDYLWSALDEPTKSKIKTILPVR